jgi:hypothetical protein
VSTALRATFFALLVLAFPGSALAAATSAGQPFPSNLFTVPDGTQLTGVRVHLPEPNCSTNPSDCADVGVLDTLDGFNIQPRISIPFSAPIDLSTVSSATVFLVGPGDHVVGINQVVWEPLTNTLHVESNEQLAQDTTYLLVVSNGIRDTSGAPVVSTFRQDLNFGQTKDPATKAYRKALLDALPMALAGGVDPDSARPGSGPSSRPRLRSSGTGRSGLRPSRRRPWRRQPSSSFRARSRRSPSARSRHRTTRPRRR